MDGDIQSVIPADANASSNPADRRKEFARLIARAAEMRSMGFSWVAVGREVGRAASTVRRWPKRFPDRWRRVYRLAVSENATAASAEAMQLLRQELRGELPRFRCDSAKAILRYLESRRWRNAKYPKKVLKELKETETSKWKIPVDQKGTTPEQIYRYIQHIESQTPEQLEAMIEGLGYKKIEPQP